MVLDVSSACYVDNKERGKLTRRFIQVHWDACNGRFPFRLGARGYQWYAFQPSSEQRNLTLIKLPPGIMQMSVTFPQIITPAMSNSLFAYSIEHNALGGHLVWVVFFVIGASLSSSTSRRSSLMSTFLPDHPIACLTSVHSLFLTEPTQDWRSKSASSSPPNSPTDGRSRSPTVVATPPNGTISTNGD